MSGYPRMSHSEEQKRKKAEAQAQSAHHYHNSNVMETRNNVMADGGNRASFRGGMGHLDGEHALEYGNKMDKVQSSEETDKDIAGLRNKRATVFRTKSYDELDNQSKKDYEELESSKKRINQIPTRK